MTDPDRRLARKARRGDRQALCRLYERHKAALLGFLVRATGRPQVAEDVFQEVWVKVLQGIEGFDGRKGTFRSWLYRIASNAAVDRSRRDAVRSGPELDAPTDTTGATRLDRLESEDPGPAREGLSRVLGRDLDSALDTLGDRQRTAVLLRHQQGMTYSEVAASIGVAEGTAKSLIFRGVRALRVQLEDWTDDRAERS
jgi:RNA polymerase sigma-70 factor (ECF subfamily)